MSRTFGCVWLSTVVIITPAAAGSAGPVLPVSFFGDVAAVALAFCLPALLAGLWIGARELWERIGWRTALMMAVVATGGLAVAFGWHWSDGQGLDIARLIDRSGAAR